MNFLFVNIICSYIYNIYIFIYIYNMYIHLKNILKATIETNAIKD